MKTEINNNIEESYCSFELSKLLKEKGFGVLVKRNWVHNTTEKLDDEFYTEGWSSGHDFNSANSLSCPTHALAIEWIRMNFGIWIMSNYIDEVLMYCYGVCEIKTNTQTDMAKFNSPQEATEAALLYTLKNLIK